MKFLDISATKSACRLLVVGAALFGVGIPAANALTLGISSIPGVQGVPNSGSAITFDGSTDSFSFTPNTFGLSLQIDNSDGVADSVGLQGNITGSFGIGTVTQVMPGYQTAPVTGSGTLSIADSYGGILTASLTFTDIFTVGASGGTETIGEGNLTNIVYTQSSSSLAVNDFVALAAAPAGTQRVTFQFAKITSLLGLKSDGTTTLATFSSTISTVPVPAAAWLFGSALLGIAGIGYRRRQSA